jgi:hypothetical protein
MDPGLYNVKDIDPADRRAFEHVLNQPLDVGQQLYIRVVTPESGLSESDEPVAASQGIPTLPEWCSVYAGLSDSEIAEIEQIALQRANLTREID